MTVETIHLEPRLESLGYSTCSVFKTTVGHVSIGKTAKQDEGGNRWPVIIVQWHGVAIVGGSDLLNEWKDIQGDLPRCRFMRDTIARRVADNPDLITRLMNSAHRNGVREGKAEVREHLRKAMSDE